MNKKQKKIVRYTLIGLGVLLLLLIVVLTPIMTEEVWMTKDFDQVQELSIVLMVIFPFLASIISFETSTFFINHTLEDAKTKLEWLLDNNYIEVSKYVEMLKYLDSVEDKKINARLEIKVKKEVAKLEQENKIKERIKKTKEELVA